MSTASVVISHNPILNWEQFNLSLDRKYIVNPKIKRRDIGGYWSFDFVIHESMIDRAFAGDFLTNGGMRHIEVFNDRGIKDWEGFIYKVIYDTGTAKVELNLNNVANKMWARYNASGTIARSTVIQDTDSQNRIGIKERVIVAGEVSASVADQGVQQYVDWFGFPSPALREIRKGRKAGRAKLEIRCLGYWHTLGWRVYNQTAVSGDADASTIVTAIINGVGQFVKTKDIETNVTQLEQEFNSDRYASEILTSIASIGDSSYHKWIVGMENDRTFYYRQASKPEK